MPSGYSTGARHSIRAKATKARRADHRQGRPSEMQEAEAGMAHDSGVPVVRLDCSECERFADLIDYIHMPGWWELKALPEFAAIDKDLRWLHHTHGGGGVPLGARWQEGGRGQQAVR